MHIEQWVLAVKGTYVETICALNWLDKTVRTRWSQAKTIIVF